MSEVSTPTMGEMIDCDSLYVAKVTLDTQEAYTTEKPTFLAPLGEVKDATKVNTSKSYYDGKPMFIYTSEDGDITVTIPGISEKEKAALVGKPYDNEKGVMYDTGASTATYYALGFRVKCSSDSGKEFYKYRWFLKGLFAISGEDVKSKADKVSPKGQDVIFTPIITTHNFSVPDPSDNTKKITEGIKACKADTTDSAFIGAENWFSAVQCPAEPAKA